MQSEAVDVFGPGAKRDAVKLWVQAVNAKGGFGTWCWDVAFKPADVQDILARHG